MRPLSALADPTRQRIVEMLGKGELSSGEIADHFAITAPAISQHLKVLKAAHLVRVRVEAQRRIYCLDPMGFAELDQWLTKIAEFWHGKLNLLEDQLRRVATQERKRRA
jgi:DNA-binding transcriptional ArsR family regulator